MVLGMATALMLGLVQRTEMGLVLEPALRDGAEDEQWMMPEWRRSGSGIVA